MAVIGPRGRQMVRVRNQPDAVGPTFSGTDPKVVTMVAPDAQIDDLWRPAPAP
jgi:hypothetical protein